MHLSVMLIDIHIYIYLVGVAFVDYFCVLNAMNVSPVSYSDKDIDSVNVNMSVLISLFLLPVYYQCCGISHHLKWYKSFPLNQKSSQ